MKFGIWLVLVGALTVAACAPVGPAGPVTTAQPQPQTQAVVAARPAAEAQVAALPPAAPVVPPPPSPPTMELTEFFGQTVRAFGFARRAHIAPMQDQPMVGVFFPSIGHSFQQIRLHRRRGFARGQTRAVRNPVNVGIHGDHRLAKGDIQHHIGGFPPHSRQGL